ncbi:MAG: hypothetical protein ACR2OD_06455 [Gaiellaceae bacterium]
MTGVPQPDVPNNGRYSSPTWLLETASDTYSQSGEDGVIATILDLLPDSEGWCVEFGAWDGQHLSNTRNLIESRSYAAVLIEADPDKFGDLDQFYAGRDDVVTLNQRIGFGSDDSLDAVLAGTPIPTDFDLLSIDIDGNDYHIWERMTAYEPRLVCIEYNPTIATEVRFVQDADHAVHQGASLLSLCELGARKGYELVAALQSNAFFVRREYFPLFRIDDNAPAALRADTTLVTHLFSGYDGLVILDGARRLPWHDADIRASRVQQVPRVFRSYPGSWGKLRSLGFVLSQALAQKRRPNRQ